MTHTRQGDLGPDGRYDTSRHAFCCSGSEVSGSSRAAQRSIVKMPCACLRQYRISKPWGSSSNLSLIISRHWVWVKYRAPDAATSSCLGTDQGLLGGLQFLLPFIGDPQYFASASYYRFGLFSLAICAAVTKAAVALYYSSSHVCCTCCSLFSGLESHAGVIDPTVSVLKNMSYRFVVSRHTPSPWKSFVLFRQQRFFCLLLSKEQRHLRGWSIVGDKIGKVSITLP